MSKYGAKKVEYDWYNFDSKAECDYYKENKDIISIVHPVFELQPSFKKYWQSIQSIKYEWDFLLTDWTVIDVKWLPTEWAKLKKKMFDYKYPDQKLLWVVKYKWQRVQYADNEKRKRDNKKNLTTKDV